MNVVYGSAARSISRNMGRWWRQPKHLSTSRRLDTSWMSFYQSFMSIPKMLRNLVQQDRVWREKVAGRYLYCSRKRATRKEQLATREVQQQERSIQRGRLDKDLTPDELRALIILFFSLLDEQTRRLYAGIESLKWGENGDSKVAEFLEIDVKTVARGRKQLLDQDIDRDRVRKPGGGRIAVEKKHRR